ncbi:uncharacterized protein LOC129779073 [Toxorhynchites rutilus septentrionalis]|uniref:uncharacterized protein LOC129779073 n=1 Tax=Toxorhynchites rutilus septentrionalis TaxID=329112 RepID=UPI002478E049|nr:uncharacterized protein LOC129779073 [Toxorhynchites rutilus septentrionalis]XP_055642310.1 uncharacterized protein LOC129779073 [Toxorhynchites rutilus septentrionalis]XP_055642316.1 uncharacterized protein LOC129779073 [Toxorhynchites rutilus septentrionalis]XP_055642327.1 uncharacterized protein LOC129779073 [Toxorhynchites rutilus septentrionalis]
MRAKAAALDEIRKSIADSDDDATRSSSGAGSSAAAQRQIDLSLLRKPILTAVTGFLEAHKAFNAGTEEIRKLLSSECDVLYECRVCRNLFRSLTNFISHKRVYCRKLFNAAQHFHFQNDGFLDQDTSMVLQAEQSSQYKAKQAHADVLSKDLSSIVERLRRKQHKHDEQQRQQSLTDYYDIVNHKRAHDDLNRQQQPMDRVRSSQSAVYPTVNQGNRTAHEIEDITSRNNNNNNMGPDRKLVESSSSPKTVLPVICDPSNRYFQPIDREKSTNGQRIENSAENVRSTFDCQDCNLRFDTEKMLKVHNDAKHTPSTHVYSCTSCPQTFLQPNLVIRHLLNDHKKSTRRIKGMRDTILKRGSTRIDEVVSKGPSRELTRLLQANMTNGSAASTDGPPEKHDEAAATRAWMENLEHFDQGPMCSYCGKTFERKAVLSTHMQTCVQKIRQAENGAGSVPPMAGVSSNSERKSKRKDNGSPDFSMSVKQEPTELAAGDDSNSRDVPLAPSQVTENGDVQINGVVTLKPEELGMQETGNRRKRKKPVIMLRNASDEIYWDMDQSTEQVKEEKETKMEIEQKPLDVQIADNQTTAKKTVPRNRTKTLENKEKKIDKDLLEQMETNGEIVCKCKKIFDDPEKYKQHLRENHKRERRYWCPVCDFKGYRKMDAARHIVQEHDMKGTPEEIEALINIQQSNKTKKKSTEPPADPIQAIIGAMGRSFDISATDISSFMDSTAGSKLTLVDTTTHETSAIRSKSALSSPKKRGRPRVVRSCVLTSTPTDKNGKEKSPSIEEDMPSANQKRPVRNRVKPVDKDFVYDLTHLLHKDADIEKFPLQGMFLDQAPPANKSRSESSRTSSISASPEKSETKKESLRSYSSKVKAPLSSGCYRGAAFAMAERQVELGHAAFRSVPEFPQNRSLTPSSMSPTKHDKQAQMKNVADWKVVKKQRSAGSICKQKSDSKVARKLTKRISHQNMLPELVRAKRKTIPRRNSVISASEQISASFDILERLNASLAAAGQEPLLQTPDYTKLGRRPNVNLKKYIDANLRDHQEAMAQVNLNGTTVEDSDRMSLPPRKRITLMQRIEDNKNKRMQEQNGSTPDVPNQSQPTEPPANSESQPLRHSSSF